MKKIILFLLSTLCIGCKSCVNKLYSVHEELTPLEITCYKQINLIDKFKKFIDSLNNGNKYCNCTTMILDKNDKIVYILGRLHECYVISIKEDRIIIPAICVPSVNPNYWLTKQEQVDDSIANRIGVWMSKEVLDKYHE